MNPILPSGPGPDSPVERRLREALAARADAVMPESLRPADVPLVDPHRRRLPGWLTRPRGFALVAGSLAGATALAAAAVMMPGNVGTTSTAPIRGWTPRCARRSMWATAACATDRGASSPTRVRTLRWWCGSVCTSRRSSPAAADTRSMTRRSWPSLMLTTHSSTAGASQTGAGRRTTTRP